MSIFLVVVGIKLLYTSQNAQQQKLSPELNGEHIARIGSFVLNEHGYILASHDMSSLPIITVSTGPLAEGDKIEGPEIEKTVELLSLFKKHNIVVESVTIYNREYCVLALPGTIRVLYNEKSDTKALTSSLQSMLSVFTIEGKMPTEIDFRFDKPVIRY